MCGKEALEEFRAGDYRPRLRLVEHTRTKSPRDLRGTVLRSCHRDREAVVCVLAVFNTRIKRVIRKPRAGQMKAEKGHASVIFVAAV